MNDEQIQTLIQAASNLLIQEREEEARALVSNALPLLPGDTQHEIILASFLDGMERETNTTKQ